jgi:hypothetical protein
MRNESKRWTFETKGITVAEIIPKRSIPSSRAARMLCNMLRAIAAELLLNK